MKTRRRSQNKNKAMKEYFKELFGYSYHFNQKLGDVFRENKEKTSEKAVKIYNHILNAHQVWNNRIEPKESPFGIWEVHPLEDLKDIDKNNFQRSLLLLETCHLNSKINFANSKGLVFQNRIQDVFFHIINHSTYHRGQIATEFRREKLEPLVTDYIFYKR